MSPLVISIPLGLIVGSFLNVVVYRLPRGQSVAVPRSYCPECGHFIRWYDNIPALSFLFLRGRCRECRRPIPWRYPMVEITTTLLAAATFWKVGAPAPAAGYFLLLIAPLVAVAFIDAQHQIIPNLISLPGIPAGILVSALFLPGPLPARLLFSIQGILVGGLLLLAVGWIYEKLRRREGLGMGDVKLGAMLGGFLGWQGIIVTLFLSSLLGSIVGIAGILFFGKGRMTAIPFGPFLSAGALLFFFYGRELLDWYLRATGKLY